MQNLMYQLCKGVSFCHGHGVLHRDLKPQNLLMDRKTMMLKIADLGLARQQVTVPLKKYTQEILTLWYRAPEVLVGARRYSTPIDMWSVGCIFAELVTNEPLFPGDSELQHFIHIFRLLGTPNEELWLGVSKLMNWREHPQWKPKNLASVVPNMDANGLDLLSMLQNEPSKRMSAKKAMEHPYLMILIKHTFESLLQWYRFKHKSVFLLFLKHTSLCTTVEKLLIVYQPVWNDKTTHFRLPWVVLVHYIVNLPRVIFKIIITGSPEIIAFDLSQLSNQTPMYLSLLGK